MRLTALRDGMVRGAGRSIPAPAPAQGESPPVPTGGWDAASPISNMPAENAVALVNWFPQPGWVELRKGYLNHSSIGVSTAIESLMAYQGETVASPRLFAAAGSVIYDATADPATSDVTALTSARWQHVNFATTGGHYLWICNGSDTPRFYDGTLWSTAVITGITPADAIHCCIYRNRIWGVLKDSTTAFYLPLDSVQGAATTLELGGYFSKGGYLVAAATWSSDVNYGTNEYIVFISSYGECAIFLIYDPTAAEGFAYRGTSSLGSPIGRRCFCRMGADLGVITIDGVFPLSKVVSYDRAAVSSLALTANIMAAMSQAATDWQSQFGWQLISYPRSNMAILNVPQVEGAIQDQFVMNTINGAWCKFTGQNANCWEIFQNRAYFGGNDGIVMLADAAAGDEDAVLEADMECAYNYLQARGRNKRLTSLRPLITKDTAFPVDLQIGISVDFQTNDAFDDVFSSTTADLPMWDDPATLWDEAVWPGETVSADWIAVSGIGYAFSVRMKISVPWNDTLTSPMTLKVNAFDLLYDYGAFI